MKDINIDKILELSQKAHDNNKYLNLETMRLIKEESFKERNPKHVSKKYRFFADDDELFKQAMSSVKGKRKSETVTNAVGSSQVQSNAVGSAQVQSETIAVSKVTENRRASLRPKIPSNIRQEIWKNHCGKSIEGECFCCLEEININKFEAGHIKPYHHGGSDTVDNLQPICSSCNKSMTTLHMYEYMIKHNKTGVKNLPYDRAHIFFIGFVETCNKIQTKLEKMVLNSKLTKTKADELRNQVFSSRLTIDERLEIIQQINKI